jgi:hypothetical protein
MTLSEALLSAMDPGADILTDAEYEAVRAWFSEHKDGPFKVGLQKLLNGEEHRILKRQVDADRRWAAPGND